MATSPDLLCCGQLNRSQMYYGVDIAAQKRRNNEINKTLRKDKKRLMGRQQILLLGTGESGKSTFLKQMKIINGKKFTEQEINSFRDTIFDNMYKGILFLLEARSSLNIPWGPDQAAPAAAGEVESHFNRTRHERRERSRAGQLMWAEGEFMQLVPHLKTVWADASIQETFRHRCRMMTENFSENTRYYLNKIDVIGVPKYTPTNEDIVWSRKPTESIIEEEISVHGSNIVFIDVGGQTKERRKWCQCFADMTSVLFLIACSHFDEHYQDKVTKEYRNKLQEAMVVFEGLINHQAFITVSIIIFFNKTDVLKEKVASRVSNIRDEFSHFPARSDPYRIEDVQNFLVESFVSFVTIADSGAAGVQRKPSAALGQTSGAMQPRASQAQLSRRRTLYRHFTTAIDRKNIETVFDAMKDTVLQNNLGRIMMH